MSRNVFQSVSAVIAKSLASYTFSVYNEELYSKFMLADQSKDYDSDSGTIQDHIITVPAKEALCANSSLQSPRRQSNSCQIYSSIRPTQNCCYEFHHMLQKECKLIT